MGRKLAEYGVAWVAKIVDNSLHHWSGKVQRTASDVVGYDERLLTAKKNPLA